MPSAGGSRFMHSRYIHYRRRGCRERDPNHPCEGNTRRRASQAGGNLVFTQVLTGNAGEH